MAIAAASLWGPTATPRARSTNFEGSHYKRLIENYGDVPCDDPELIPKAVRAFFEILGQTHDVEKLDSAKKIAGHIAGRMGSGLLLRDFGMVGVGMIPIYGGLGALVGLGSGIANAVSGQVERRVHHRASDGEAGSLVRLSHIAVQEVNDYYNKQMVTGSDAVFADLRRQNQDLSTLQKNRFKAMLQSAAAWSLPEKTIFQGSERELCWLVNYALDNDFEDLIQAALPLIRGFTKFCGVDRISFTHLAPHSLPDPDADGIRRVYRGGGFDESHCDFFVEGKDYRNPGFVATSFSQSKARDFMIMAESKGFPAIEWTFEVEDGCMHAMYLEGVYSTVLGERELTLGPYAWVRVKKVRWSTRGNPAATTHSTPHRITLQVFKDNLLAPPNLPLSPWR